MASSGMLSRVALVKIEISEELSAYVFRVRRIGDLGTYLYFFIASFVSYAYIHSSSILVTPIMEALSSSETSVLTRATRRNVPENAVLHFELRLQK
jgi:hypothetical protein